MRDIGACLARGICREQLYRKGRSISPSGKMTKTPMHNNLFLSVLFSLSKESFIRNTRNCTRLSRNNAKTWVEQRAARCYIPRKQSHCIEFLSTHIFYHPALASTQSRIFFHQKTAIQATENQTEPTNKQDVYPNDKIRLPPRNHGGKGVQVVSTRQYLCTKCAEKERISHQPLQQTRKSALPNAHWVP